MSEQRISASGPATWPGSAPENQGNNASAGQRAGGCAAAVTEVTVLVGDTRRLILTSGGLLTADVAGVTIVVAALLRHGPVVAWGAAALLVPVILSWLASAVALVLAEQPTACALGELRRATGAPVDPAAPWRPLGVRPLADADLAWDHAAPLIGTAAVAHARARLALKWAVIATAGFLLWTMVSLAIAAVS